MNVMEDIGDRLSIFKNLYDILRIVDPVNKKVISFEDNTACNAGNCFDFWNREDYCKNCVSMRAYLENDTCIKLEYKDDKAYLSIASPIMVDGKFYIIEMLKDLTSGSSIFKEGLPVNNIEKFVMELNNKLVTDDISGAYSRKYLMERLTVDINEGLKNNQPISVIALDVDFFSKTNQIHGYKLGDKILKELVQLMSKQIRSEQDWIARYGGDKFVLVLCNCKLQDGYLIAENLRQAIQDTCFVGESSSASITASIAICELTGITDCSSLLLHIKDTMYKAKSQGRNRVVIGKL